MSDFLSKIFGMSKVGDSGISADPALKQGARFNRMQNTITGEVYPQLPLMDQTTSPGLGSITETLDNMNPNLESINNKEVKNLEKMQKVYNNVLAQLKVLQSQVKTSSTSAHMKKLVTNINELNGKIMSRARNITSMAYKTNTANIDTNNSRDRQREKIKHSIKNMAHHKMKLDSMLKQQYSLDGQIEDQQYDLDANYLHYIVWFLAASTISFITVKQLSK